MKKILKLIFALIGILLVSTALLFLVLTITDFQPEKIIPLETQNNQEEALKLNNDYSIITWNIGYASLSENEDFFMDDGEKSRPDNKELVENNLNGIINSFNEFDLDLAIIQEIDIKSRRSYYINQLEALTNNFKDYSYNFAKNYDVLFVPVPFPPLGKIESGISTFSKYLIDSSERHQFEGNYSWPKKIAMLDRCYTVSTLPIENKNEKLILINAHFSAYDNGSLREKQLKEIKTIITDEYAKGNYVIVGGDFNQTFSFIDVNSFPLYKNGNFYMPHPIPNDFIDDTWTWGVSEIAPTYRLLDSAYNEGVTQVGIIDGFLVSPNINIKEVETLDYKFKYTDHNPVKMIFELN